MIKLRLVGPSDDLQFLVYSSSRTGRKGSHLVEVDDELFDVLESMVRERRRSARGERDHPRVKQKQSMPRVESKLAPKDVQRLLRSGRTVEQVAKTAGVPVAWVEQFLGVVQYERIGIVNEVRRSWMEKQRLGQSGAPLGESVEINLRARHVRLTDQELADAWDAYRVEDQPWIVSLVFRFRGRAQKATWKFDPATRTVTPANRLASDLGWVAPGRSLQPRPKERSEPIRTRSKIVKKKSTARSKPKRKAPVRKKPAKKKSVARSKPSKKRGAKRSSAKKRVAKKRVTRRAGTSRATKRRSARRR
ncbi:MAG: septation protein SepH [Actinomycetota bacterium]